MKSLTFMKHKTQKINLNLQEIWANAHEMRESL